MPIYSSTGAFNVAVNDTTGRGRYSASGALRINLVTGASYVGLYATDGALNVVDISGINISTYGGLYHPSGAIRGRTAPTTYSGLQAPDGSYYFNGLFSPLNLFANGEQGVWYDPSDFTTLFQDNTGTTPVTAVDQSVGLMLDKSQGLTLGAELVTNGDFSNGTTGWSTWNTNAQISVTNGQMTVAQPVGGNQVGVGNSTAYTTVVGRTYKVSLNIISTVGSVAQLRIGDFNGGVSTTIFSVPSGTGERIGYFVANTTATFVNIATGSSAGNSITFDNISVKLLSGNHASQSVLASRPLLKQDAGGFYHLLFDGSNDSFATSSINFGVTNKMTLFAGVRKLSDAALGVILEAAPNYTVAGGIGIFAPDGAASARYSFAMTGATGAQSASTPANYAAPVTSVLQSSMDISQLGYAGLTARINGAAVALSYSGAGVTSTGNFGNYVLHIGRRDGSTFPFNGRLYSLIVRGAQSTNAQITNTEAWVNGKTGAY